MSYVATPSQTLPSMARQAGDPTWLAPTYIRNSNTGHAIEGEIGEGEEIATAIKAAMDIARTIKDMEDQRKADRAKKQAADNAAKAAAAQARAAADAAAQVAATAAQAAGGNAGPGGKSHTVAYVGIGVAAIVGLGLVWFLARRK